MKRVLFITREIVPFYYGGIGTLFKAVAKALMRRGHQVAILGERPPGFNEELLQLHYGAIRSHLYPAAIEPDGVDPLERARDVWRHFREIYSIFTPDVVIHADFGGESLLVLLDAHAGLYPETSFIVTINGMHRDIDRVHEGGEQAFWEQWLHNPDLRTFCAMEDLTIQLADKVVSPTAWVWNQVRKRTRNDTPIRIIPNLSDSDFFGESRAGGSPNAAGRKENPVILFIGRLDRVKGADLLLEAYLRLAKEKADALPPLVLIGRDIPWKSYGTSFRNFWQQRIPPFLQNRISFAGQIPHERIGDYLQRSVLCVFPSRWEAFGIVCLEAMQAGCPVLVSRDTGLAEVVGPGFPELLFHSGEGAEALAMAMKNLLASLPSADLSARLRSRVHEVLKNAEEAWESIVQEEAPVRHMLEPRSGIRQEFHRNLLQVLVSSREDRQQKASCLKIYLRRNGQYTETDALVLSYPRYCWSTLHVALPDGTGEFPLRLDPADETGLILLESLELIVHDAIVWRCDGSDLPNRIAVVGEGDQRSIGGWFAFHSRTNDPQLLLDCPEVGHAALLKIRLCFEPRP